MPSRLASIAAATALVATSALPALPALSVLPADAVGVGTAPGNVAAWSTTTGTDGRVYIADEQGRALQFHGFNVKTPTPEATVTDALLADATSRGLDHLRLSVFWQDLEPTQGTYDETYLDQVVTVLDRAERHGIVVIIDMHQDVFGESFNSRGMPAWATRTDGHSYEPQASWLLDYLQPAVQAAWEHLYEDADLRQAQIDAWLHIVNRVKDHPAVFGYDLLNEPFGKIRDGETLFTAAERVESQQLTPMYQRLTDAISAVDADHWVFIEPPNLASLGVVTSLGRVTGPKVAVYPHMYDPNIELATYTPDGVIQLDPAFFDTWANAITNYTRANPMPMLVGEWGIANPDVAGMDTFVERSLATMDRVTSGWSVFNMCRGTGYCPLDASGNPRPSIGQIFQPYARAIAGAPTSTAWNRSTSSLRVDFADNAATGTTEIYLGAANAYPDGWTVTTTDASGTWSSTYNEATGVLSVTTADTGGDHAICVAPVGAADPCAATPVSAPTPAPTPVKSTPAFTG
jgi:endoglycosylceramidase